MKGTGAFDLTGRVAVVTGASQGLGREMAVALATAGATVVTAARNAEGLAGTVQAVEDRGGRAWSIVCDVTAEADVVALADRTVERHGQVDLLVNNAGIAVETRAAELSVEEFRRTLDVNVLGAFVAAREVGRHMIARGNGKIVNIGSVMGLVGTPGVLAYSTSKAALLHLTRTLAVEWARYGVTVNALALGYVPTRINADRLAEEEVAARIKARVPLRRFGRVDEVGPTIVYLASPATDYMTGQILVLDGGLSAQ